MSFNPFLTVLTVSLAWIQIDQFWAILAALGILTKSRSIPDFEGLRSNPKSSPAVFDLVKKQRYKQQNHK